MKDDPAIRQVREARHLISEKCCHDPKRLVEYYLQRQKQHPERLVKEQRFESDTSDNAVTTDD
ncbi:MAG TPA: hypothetical protein PLG59_00775 [bacterium]|nr:hypothetical protein [bacterium]HQP99929.1 hypothetical protein [bacterium]